VGIVERRSLASDARRSRTRSTRSNQQVGEDSLGDYQRTKRAAAGDLVVELLLYLSSYAPLFVLLALRFEPKGLMFVCAGLALVGFVAGPIVLARFRSVAPQVWQLKTVEDRGAEVSGYLATFLLPFVAVANPDTRQIIGYGLFVALAGLIYLRSGLVQINPTLYLFGWRVLAVRIGDGWTGYVLTKRHLPASATLPLVRLSERVYVDYAEERDG
jgi:hypothetical protein